MLHYFGCKMNIDMEEKNKFWNKRDEKQLTWKPLGLISIMDYLKAKIWDRIMRFYLIWCGTTTWGEIDFSKRNFRLRIQLVHNANTFNKMLCLEASFFSSTSPYRCKREVEKNKNYNILFEKGAFKRRDFYNSFTKPT